MFVCHKCSHVTSAQDFKDAGADFSNCEYTECFERYQGKGSTKEGYSSGCDWCACGLFGIPNDNFDIVVTSDEKEKKIFRFADCEK